MRPFDVMVSIQSWPDVEGFESSKGLIRRLLLRPRRDEKEVDVGASNISKVELILYIGATMPGVLLPRKVVRNIHKIRSVIRLIVKLVAENLRSLTEVELVSVNHDLRVKNSGEVSYKNAYQD